MPTAPFNAIICRTNAGVVESAISQYEDGFSVAVIITGGLEGLRKFAEGAESLMRGEGSDHPELVAFKNWHEVQAYVADAEGADLRPMVRLIDNHGVAAIYGVCRNSLPEQRRHEADVQICTAHKSKGLEFDRVRIYGDWPQPKNDDPTPAEMIRLAYVAATRARLVLDCTMIDWIIYPERRVPINIVEAL